MIATVKFHINNILSKMGVGDRTQAAISALKRGIDCQFVVSRKTHPRIYAWVARNRVFTNILSLQATKTAKTRFLKLCAPSE
ncbi:LuxR C-terminal-related transcriptional regulator [Microcoleus sp.]|uniref:LuxR C-terminal-related transcriptional regulator n=1 Tax=Microcoleus sp. TaxID=44472 RepID=UPI003C7373B8